jgi:hypothetical protein
VKCSICSHGDEPAISAAIANGASYRRVAARYKVGLASVGRHARSCVSLEARDRAAAKALNVTVANLSEQKLAESSNLLSNLIGVRTRLFAISDRARLAGNLLVETQVEKNVLAALTVEAKVLGELGAHSTTINQSLVLAPDYFRLRSALMSALAPYPAARNAVSAALRTIETTAPADEPQLAIGGPTSGA